MDEALELELRIVQLFFQLGYLSRQRVALKSYFYPEQVDVTDIDAYGIKWDLDFSPKIIVSQCRTSRSKSQERPANGILWLRGLKELTAASEAYLVMPSIPQRLKTFAQLNGLVPLDYPRLDELEKQVSTMPWIKSFRRDAFQKKIEAWSEIQSDESRKFTQHYWFLVSDFWSMSNNVRIKRCVHYAQQLIKYTSIDRLHHRWLLVESVVLLSIGLLSFCHEAFALSPGDRKKYIEVKMIEGLGTVEDEEKILEYANALAASIIEEKTGQKLIVDPRRMKMLAPTYTPALVELIERIIDKPELSVHVPRLLDLLLYEGALMGRSVEKDALERVFGLDEERLDVLVKLGKNVVRFLDGGADSRPLFKNLLSF